MDTKKIKILIAEDNSVMRKVLRSLLTKEHMPYDIYEVESGEAVEEMVGKLDIDWLFLDLYLPNINGDKIVDSIKKNPNFNDLEIVMISAETDRKKIIDLLNKQRIFNYLVKPVTKERLESTVNELLKKRG